MELKTSIKDFMLSRKRTEEQSIIRTCLAKKAWCNLHTNIKKKKSLTHTHTPQKCPANRGVIQNKKTSIQKKDRTRNIENVSPISHLT